MSEAEAAPKIGSSEMRAGFESSKRIRDNMKQSLIQRKHVTHYRKWLLRLPFCLLCSGVLALGTWLTVRALDDGEPADPFGDGSITSWSVDESDLFYDNFCSRTSFYDDDGADKWTVISGTWAVEGCFYVQTDSSESQATSWIADRSPPARASAIASARESSLVSSSRARFAPDP